MLSLAAEAGAHKQTEIRSRLKDEGLSVSGAGFSAWIYGDSAASRRLPEAFARAFDLTEQKKVRLAVAFTFGQNRPFTEAGDLPEIQAAMGQRNVSA
jgi:hypothetical protein